MVGTLVNKFKRGERHGQWAKEALSEGLIKAMGWYDKNIHLQAHGVIRNKEKGKAIADTTKWYGRD